MNYIVIDLEWNQSPMGRRFENKGLPFEIIEIGGIKLDKDRKMIDSFHEIIKPQVYKEMHFKTKEVIPIRMEDLKDGISFREAAERFFQWCGSEPHFCTWGDTDLTELQRNMDFYHMAGIINKAIPYYDVQKLFSIVYEGKKNPKTLEYAVNYLGIKKKEIFHRAINDAEYTARIFQKLDEKIIKSFYSIDFYKNPLEKKDEIYVVYEGYSKYISMEYDTKKEALEEKDVKSTICCKCKKKAAKKLRWFSYNAKNYYCLSYCKEHGYLKGKIRLKKSKNGNFFVVKTINVIDEEEAGNLRKKKDELRIKRREKRRKNN